MTRTGMLVGTAAYLAPERATGGPATPASDLYSLGVVAYECLTGQAPFDGEPLAVALAHLQQAIPPLPPSVPATVAALVADLTAKDPSARPPSATDVSDRVERLPTIPQPPPAAALASPPPAAAPAPPPSSAASASPRSADEAPAGPCGAPPDMPNEPGGRPSGQAGAGDARSRPWRRLPRAGAPARAALVLAAAAVAGLGWALATTHGSAPDHRLSQDSHPASRQADPPGAAARPHADASPSPTSTGGDGPHRSPAAAHPHRRGRAPAAPSSPSSHSPSPTPTPSLPLPTPSLSLSA